MWLNDNAATADLTQTTPTHDNAEVLTTADVDEILETPLFGDAACSKLF